MLGKVFSVRKDLLLTKNNLESKRTNKNKIDWEIVVSRNNRVTKNIKITTTDKISNLLSVNK